MTPRLLTLILLAILVVLVTTAPLLAADTSAAPLLAGGYWEGFIKHWSGALQKQNGIVLAVLLVGILCLFIITRGKWKN